MIKEWATVVSWQDGVALVSCDVKASCSSCASRAGCGSRVLNKLGPQTSHTIAVSSDQPLVAGQKVELGIAEGSLLTSAILVYLSPLAGLFVMGGVFQMLFGTDSGLLKAFPQGLPPGKPGSPSFSALHWHPTNFVLRRSLLRPGDLPGFIIIYIAIK